MATHKKWMQLEQLYVELAITPPPLAHVKILVGVVFSLFFLRGRGRKLRDQFSPLSYHL